MLHKEVSTYEEAYALYNKYAREIGFSVRKHTRRKDTKTGIFYEYNFCCSCEGIARREKEMMSIQTQEHEKDITYLVIEEYSKTDENTRKRRKRTVNITRTGCNAKIRFKLKDGFYKVIEHVI